ncbi:MAG: DUF2070 family protein [Thaumarchaeota archaeon]|nr:DUF2070 family protein [Nitrososphaerota archaeon]
MSKEDSTANIARRYRHLFRLPIAPISIIYASIPALLVALLVRYFLHDGALYILSFAVLTEVLLLLGIEIDRQVLKKKSRIATFRRLASISIMSNSIWLIVSLVAIFVLAITKSDGRFLAVVILGSFFAMAFRALVFGSVFYRKTLYGLPLAIVQPAFVLLPSVLSLKFFSLYSISILSSLVAGFIGLAALELYLSSINRVQKLGQFRPIHLLQAFLDAWTLEDARAIERFLELVGRERVVETTTIKLDSLEKSALLIVPGVHPGPFYPIGSSNLPYDIYSKLHSSTLTPMTVHSISDHDLNLSSRSQVEKYVYSLSSMKPTEEGSSISLPVVKKKNKATVSGIAFGSTALIALTQAPDGMEDFPVSLREEIEREAERLGFQAFIIDTHNSEGSKPSDEECKDALDATRHVLEELKVAERHEFDFGFAHSSELGLDLGRDIGPAGFGLKSQPFCLEAFALVIVDANNAHLGFRDKVFELFESRNKTRILELCTSDTHVTAAKTKDAKGYVALGDLVSAEVFETSLSSLYERARAAMKDGRYSVSLVKTAVKTIGSEVLEDFSGLLDATISTAKNGAVVLGILAMVLIAAVAII